MSCEATLIEKMITFVFGKKKYEVDPYAATFDLIVLPDERVLEVGDWVGDHSQTPQRLKDTKMTKSDFRDGGNSVDTLPVAEEINQKS